MKLINAQRPTNRVAYRALALSVTLSLFFVAALCGQDKLDKKASQHNPDINKQFVNPDVKAFIARFETNSREVYAKRAAIVSALGLKRGVFVADIGAGTGLFTQLIAEKVGPEGKVFAVDIADNFLEHIENQAKKLKHPQVQTVSSTQDSTNLAVGSIDMAFLCDVYHHFEKPEKTLASIRRALRSRGQLIVVDFDRVKGKSSDFVLKHIRAEKSVFITEIKAAGFELEPSANEPKLKENFFLRFRKIDDPAPKPIGPVGE